MGDAYKGDLSFAGSLEAFGAGKDDHLSVAIGGYSFYLFVLPALFQLASVFVFSLNLF